MSKRIRTSNDAQRAACGLLRKFYKSYGSWSKVSRATGVNKGLASAIARGVRNAPASVLRALGLPVIINVPAPCCPRCGVVHVARRCPNARRPVRRWREMTTEQLQAALDGRQEM